MTDEAIGPRLSLRNVESIRAQCNEVLTSLPAMGRLMEEKDPKFEKFPEEDDNNLINFKLMDQPIEDMSGKTRKVVRITDKPFLKMRDSMDHQPLDRPIYYPNGLFITDSRFNPHTIYVFSKRTGKDGQLLPVGMLSCSPHY